MPLLIFPFRRATVLIFLLKMAWSCSTKEPSKWYLNVEELNNLWKSLHAYLLGCFYEIHLKFLTSHIYVYLANCELCKQHQFLSGEMRGQIWDIETVEPQEISIKVCVIFITHCQINYIEAVGKKASFLAIVWFIQIYNCRFINGGGAV